MAGSNADNEPLLKVAQAVVNGDAVDWSTVGPSADRDTIGGLESLGALIRALRQVTRTFGEEISPGSRWGSLTIVEKIDEGSFGGVYRARDQKLDLDVALKLLYTDEANDHATAGELLDEARLLAKVRHPNVVRVYGVDDTLTPPGLWMEFIAGKTLADVVDQQGPSSAREAAAIGVDLCRALAAVHAVRLVHGDIKARNVVRENGGRIVLMDFGAARLCDSDASRLAFGTPSYAAPEVLERGDCTPLGDLYSLGVLLFYLVSGEYPVEGRTPMQLIDAHQNQRRRRLRDVRPDLPDRFVETVERAISFNPADRFKSAGDFEAALNETQRPARWSVKVLAAAAVAAVLALIIAVAVWSRPNGNLPSVSSEKPAEGRSTTTESFAFTVNAAFFKLAGAETLALNEGDRVHPGDRLMLKYEASRPTYLYVVNEPDQGQSFLLFPLPGRDPVNPVSSNLQHVLPNGYYWQVTSLGGREHFVIIASAEPVGALEELLARIPSPRTGEPINSAALPPATVERLRGVGGLVAAGGATPGPRLASLFTTPLRGREQASGMWARQLVLNNP